MICYRDTTFCSSPGCRNQCGRQFTDQDRVAAQNWWGGDDFPVAMAAFCDEAGNLLRESGAA